MCDVDKSAFAICARAHKNKQTLLVYAAGERVAQGTLKEIDSFLVARKDFAQKPEPSWATSHRIVCGAECLGDDLIIGYQLLAASEIEHASVSQAHCIRISIKGREPRAQFRAR